MIRLTFIAFLTLTLQIVGLKLCAQQPSITLSQKHLAKVERIKSPKKKLEKYRKFYSKDSIKVFKQADRYLKHWSDSVENTTQTHKQKWTTRRDNFQQSLTEKVSKKSNVLAAKATLRESDYKLSPEWEKYYSATSLKMLYNFLQYYLTELKTDTLQLKRLGLPSSKISSLAGLEEVRNKVNVPTPGIGDPLVAGKAKTNQLKGEVTNHKSLKAFSKESKRIAKYNEEAAAYKKLYGTLPTSKDGVVDFGESKLQSLASQRKEMKQAEALKKQFGANATTNPWENNYKEQADQLQDSSYLKEQAKKKAEELAMQYLEDNPAVMEGVQKKIALLMKKYSVVPNSNDLSTAVKRSSLEGKPLRQRLHIATNFQVINIDPFSIDFSPAIGYKFNRAFIAGIGGTYRETFSKKKSQLSPDVLGYKAFVSYDVLKSIFAYGEFANNSPGFEKTETGNHRIWKQALLLGAGRKFSVHRKVEMTCLVAYNFLHKPNDPIYPRPLVVRVGFQLSELAMLKK